MESLWFIAIVLFGLVIAGALYYWSAWRRQIVRRREARGEPRHSRPPDVPIAKHPQEGTKQ